MVKYVIVNIVLIGEGEKKESSIILDHPEKPTPLRELRAKVVKMLEEYGGQFTK